VVRLNREVNCAALIDNSADILRMIAELRPPPVASTA
jgi:hypothetical protein